MMIFSFEYGRGIAFVVKIILLIISCMCFFLVFFTILDKIIGVI